MLEAKEVNFAYLRGQPVLNDIDIKIESGEFVALLGHNGSGKTTLSRLFMALIHPRSGQVLVDGTDIAAMEPADLADKIGYVFQNPDLQILEDTVFDEVAYGPRAKKLSEDKVKRQVETALAATGLTDLADAYPRLLSFGQKRRLGVAAALALNPRTLILDEITNGQDAVEKERMMSYLKALNEENGITVVLISHDMDTVRRYAQRTIVLHNGHLVFDGTPAKLFDGSINVERWGLRCPTATAVGNALGITATSPEDFCSSISMKGVRQIIVTVAVTAWVFILPVMAVATILVLELALLLSIKHDRMTMAAIGGLAVFTGLMVLLQLLFGSPLEIALVGGLRMLVMTMAFLCMLAATRIQDIAQALVTKFHLPCEYAFMLTTALRFVPNFLADSTITLDAQSCRGYSNRGNAIKRLMSYVVVIRPLVMRAVAKSETLALSMELKGFGANTYKNMPQQKLGLADYVVLLAVIALSTYPFWQEYVKI